MFVALHTNFRGHLRYVDGEFMRLGKHASLMTGTAIVAKIREIANVVLGKAFAELHCGKDRAQALAVAARIADC